MDRITALPGPPSELGPLEVEEGLLNLAPGVHHEGTVLDHWLADGAPLKEQEARWPRAVFEG